MRRQACLVLFGFLTTSIATAATTLWVKIGEQSEAGLGYGFCGGLDFDGDGLMDVMAAGGAAPGQHLTAGKVYIWSGADQSLLLSLVGRGPLPGAVEGDYLGSAGGPAGRVNRDDLDDFVIGAFGFDDYFGKIYVRAGQRRLAKGNPLLFVKEGRSLGLDRSSGFGSHIASTPGDFDHDGRADIAVGAPRHAGNNGRVYIWSLYGRLTVLVKDGTAGGNLGQSMAFADVNRDGFSDLIVSEPFINGNGRGRVHVLLGPQGRPARYSPIRGENDQDTFGWLVASLGDFDGDRIDDFAVSAPSYSGTLEQQGIVYVYSGVNGSLIVGLYGSTARDALGINMSGAGDFNHDGFADLAIRFGRPPHGVAVMPGPDVGEGVPLAEYQRSHVGNLCAVGDTNNDGFDDLLVASPGDSEGGLRAGKIYVESFYP